MKRNIFSTIAVAALLLSACSENDNPSQPSTGKSISFSIDLSQDWRGEQEGTRASIRRQPVHAVPMQRSDGGQLWLKGITTNGIKMAGQKVACADETRGAKVTAVSGMSDFSSFCYKPDNTKFFYNVKTDPYDGTLAQAYKWPEDQPLKFFAIHPYNAGTFSGDAAEGISVDFEVNSDVASQTDLMYAVTGELPFDISENAPLHFQHALTAVDFVMGTFDFEADLKEIKLKNVYTKGTFTLPTSPTICEGENPPTGTWSDLDGQDEHKVDVEEYFNTSTDHFGETITTGNKTFLMIPQALDGVEVEITLDVEGELITINGSLENSPAWEPGTTRTYYINSSKDISQYMLRIETLSREINYDDESFDFDIVSDYIKSDGSLASVEWEITDVTYGGGDGTTGWLTLPTEGTGSQALSVPVAPSVIDKKAERDNALKNATPVSDYDLSTHDLQGNTTLMNTANCYVISAPGTYKIPLVYGNAVKDGAVNTNSYTYGGSATSNVFSPLFYDHFGGLAGPGLKDREDPVSGELLWSDINDDVVTNLNVDNTDGDYGYLTFEVPAANLTEHGNAVVAVRNSGGLIMWSWHLWFTTPDALETITCTNKEGETFDFTEENLGFKYSKWEGSAFDSDRTATITIRQKAYSEATEGDEPKTLTFTVTQKAGRDAEFSSLFYQVGRKDPFPDSANDKEIFKVSALQAANYQLSIKNPTTLYYYSTGGTQWYSQGSYRNAWSANNPNESPAVGDAVVKTIYDPCPVGFCMPPYDAFSGFFPSVTRSQTDMGNTSLILPASTDNEYNYRTWVNASKLAESSDQGWWLHSYGKEGANQEERFASREIFFPITGAIARSQPGLTLTIQDLRYGRYWCATPYSNGTSWSYFYFTTSAGNNARFYFRLFFTVREEGYAARPIKDKW